MKQVMKLLVGLGNPGPRYETTRHNAGFLALDRLIDVWSARELGAKFLAELWEASVSGEKCLLMKPQTFMNLSGTSVSEVARFYKVSAGDIYVLYDDVDIEKGEFRLKVGGGSAGHNGIRSLDEHLKALGGDYVKIRIGVGRPPLLASGKKALPTDAYVLEPFSDDELDTLDKTLERVTDAVTFALKNSAIDAMNRFNTRTKDSKEDTDGL